MTGLPEIENLERPLRNPLMDMRIIIITPPHRCNIQQVVKNKGPIFIVMKVNYPKDNPFERSNPFKIPTKMHSHPGIANRSLNYDDLLYKPSHPQCSINLWSFKEDNSRKFNPYIVKTSNQEMTAFQKSMKISSVSTRRDPPRNRLSSSYIQENPFHRKNLLISRAEVEKEIETDINLISYKYWVKESDTARPKPWETPIESFSIDNASFMPTLHQRQSMLSRRSSKQMSPLGEEQKVKKMSSLQKHSSMQKRESRQKRESLSRKSISFEQKGAKEEVTVRGKKYHLAKVFAKE